MEKVKLFEEFMTEGVYDPGILKAFFMAGGPGSGKSYVAGEIFGFLPKHFTSVSYATGLKLVNNDNAFEKELKAAGYDASKIGEYAEDPEVWSQIMTLRDKAKNLTRRLQNNYIGGRLGQVIDGTGKNFNKIRGQRELYKDLGYDTYMVFVNTSLEIALERNKNRERVLPDKIVKDMWKAVQDNLGKFQKLFGSDKMLIVDNSVFGDDILDQVESEIARQMNTPVQNPLGKIWIRDAIAAKQGKNRPM